MATVLIGGTEYHVPPMNFAALKAAWADIKALSLILDPVEQAATAVRIVACALKETAPDLSVDAIERKLGATEFPALVHSVVGILSDAGLVPSGEPAPQQGNSISTP